MKHILEHFSEKDYLDYVDTTGHTIASSSSERKSIRVYLNGRIRVETYTYNGTDKIIKIHIDTDKINEAIDVYNNI